MSKSLPLSALVGLLSLLPALLPARANAQEVDPAEVAIGERLFLETRFAEFFARNSGGDVNAPLAEGDPSVATTETPGGPLPGPFAGASMNCRSCHLVDEQLATDSLGNADFDRPGGMRTYTDFARRSPVPLREDGATHAVRNSPPLVNSSIARKGGLLLHFDGEFESLPSLARGTLLGRNYGWLADEGPRAAAHIARVIREDDGSGELAQEFGGPYALVLAGTDASIPEELRLPRPFRIDVYTANDAAIVRTVSSLIGAYVEQLEFQRDEAGLFIGSPFDQFLIRNGLPREPKKRESSVDYTRRLAAALDRLASPRFIDGGDGEFAFHDQAFAFGPDEFEGLKIFLREPPRRGRRNLGTQSGVGNCAACHPAPLFTDFLLHNTGVTQVEYDDLHGRGAFAALEIPTSRERQRDPEAYLPPTPIHPGATGRFRAIADAGRPELTDLGLWNVYGNADFRAVQARLKQALLRSLSERRGRGDLLEAAIARFKTPGLRDLSHSNPYMHNGAFDSLEDVVELYNRTSELQRSGDLRNGASELADIRLAPRDVSPLASFLRALNEDYE